MIGFICGRFQPLHLGHVKLIRQALEECSKLYVGIGSAQESRTGKNPFTFEERRKMLLAVFPELHIIEVADIFNPPKWAKYVLAKIPEAVDMYYAGTPADAHLFQYEMVSIKVSNRLNDKSGTEIRDMIYKENEEWTKFVPNEVVPIVRELFHG